MEWGHGRTEWRERGLQGEGVRKEKIRKREGKGSERERRGGGKESIRKGGGKREERRKR